LPHRRSPVAHFTVAHFTVGRRIPPSGIADIVVKQSFE
jgi:hypothetical protein